MLAFTHLRSLAEFRSRHLPSLRTIEDLDLAWQIGHQQILGSPLTLKRLLLLGIGSVATVQRRLQRLKRLDVIRARRSKTDRRVIELTLRPSFMATFGKYATILSEAQPASTSDDRSANGHGHHLCALCDGEASCRDMAVRFVKEGLRLRRKCVVVGPQSARDAICAELQGAGMKLPRAGQLVFSGGEGSPESMLALLRGIFREARAAGKTVHLIGNMSWAQGKMDFDALMEFETRVERLIRRFRAEAICQYDLSRFSGQQALRALKCHPETTRRPLILG
jgi:hypothetical protein